MVAPPTFDDVLAARIVLAAHLPPTPLVRAWSLSERLGAELFLKCENTQPIGAFKVRGGLNLLASLSPAERSAGVFAASTGNHAQSIAYAARLFGVHARIYMPRTANPLKLERVRDLGADVRQVGRDFDDAREACEADAARAGARYAHSANEPAHVAGVATLTIEIFDALPEPPDMIIVPVGGGSGAAAAALATKSIHPATQVIGVQSAAAPALYHAWHERHLRPHARMETAHEGLATRVPFEMTIRMMWELLDDFVLVEDGEIDAAIRTLAVEARLIAEGAGAAATAAALGPLCERIAGRRVVAILSGGNLPPSRMAELLATG